MQFAISPVLGQAIPGNRSQLAWILSTQNSMSALLVLISAAAIFAGACYLVTTRRSVAALAAYLILLPLPCLISVFGWIDGSVASLSVIAASTDINVTTADIAGGLASALVGLEIALLVSAPTYVVLAYGLLTRTLQPPTSAAKPLPTGATSPVAPNVGLPLPSPTL